METESTKFVRNRQLSTHGHKAAVVIWHVVVIYRKSDESGPITKHEPSPSKSNKIESEAEFEIADGTSTVQKAENNLGVQNDSARAIAEIDNVLRTMCSVDDQGKGLCETCPYREHFFAGQELQYSSK